MQKRLTTIATLGFFVIIIPFFGIPLVWKQWILLVFGAAIMALALLVRHKGHSQETNMTDKPYAENGHRIGTNDEIQR